MTATTLPDVLAEVMRTPLGDALLDTLDALGVRITCEMPPQLVADKTTYGAYDHNSKTLYMMPGLPLEVALHVFAHEARHALQLGIHTVCEGYQNIFNTFSDPKMAALNMRLREIDADVFAVYFLFDHARFDGSAHYDAMLAPVGQAVTLNRGTLYQAFERGMEGQDAFDPGALAEALRAAANAWRAQEFPALYDRLAVENWHNSVPPVVGAAAADPQHGAVPSLRRYQLSTPETRLAVMGRYARHYAQLLGEAGFPDYVGNGDSYVRRLLAEAPYAAEVAGANKKHKAVMRAFRQGRAA